MSQHFHAYATDAHGKVAATSTLALYAYFATVGLTKLSTGLMAHIGWQDRFVIPITYSAVFATLLAIYNHWLWSRVHLAVIPLPQRIPNLNGTWVGCALPNYQAWPHLAIIHIEQTWSQISITETAIKKGSPDEAWDPHRELGTNRSSAVSLTNHTGGNATANIVYRHEGSHDKQPTFHGVMHLKLSDEDRSLTGNYFTNRKGGDLGEDSTRQFIGSQGPVALERLPGPKHLTPKIVIEQHMTVIKAMEDRVKKLNSMSPAPSPPSTPAPTAAPAATHHA